MVRRWLAVVVAVLALVWLLPGGAAHAATRTRVSLAASKATLPYGATLTLSGRATTTSGKAVRSGKVVVEYRTTETPTWRRLAVVRTSTTGRYSTKTTVDGNRAYRARLIKTSSRRGSTSPTRRVSVTPAVTTTFTPAARRLIPGGRVTYAGTVAPAGDYTAELQQVRDGVWTTRQQVPVTDGSYTITDTLTEIGSTTLRLRVVPATAQLSTFTSRRVVDVQDLTTWTITPEGVGLLRIGMRAAQAIEQGTVAPATDAWNAGCLVNPFAYMPGAALWAAFVEQSEGLATSWVDVDFRARGRENLDTIGINTSRIATDTGVRRGDTLDALRSAYGDALQPVVDAKGVDDPYTKVVFGKEKTSALVFFLDADMEVSIIEVAAVTTTNDALVVWTSSFGCGRVAGGDEPATPQRVGFPASQRTGVVRVEG